MYKRDEGSLSCTPCPQNTHIAEGSLGVGQDSCVCLPGFRKGRSGDCEGNILTLHSRYRLIRLLQNTKILSELSGMMN